MDFFCCFFVQNAIKSFVLKVFWDYLNKIFLIVHFSNKFLAFHKISYNRPLFTELEFDEARTTRLISQE